MSYLTKEQLVALFAEAWRTLSPELIIDNLDESFVYDSQWVFESLDYSRYKEYLRNKFSSIRKSNTTISVEIVKDPNLGGTMLSLTQNGNTIYYRLKVKKGKVIKGDLCMI